MSSADAFGMTRRRRVAQIFRRLKDASTFGLPRGTFSRLMGTQVEDEAPPCERCGDAGKQVPCQLCLGFGGRSEGNLDMVCGLCEGLGHYTFCQCRDDVRGTPRAWRAMCSVLVGSGVMLLIWLLLAVLLVEDRHAYVERARDWSVGAAVRK